jgi:hypothetical protein
VPNPKFHIWQGSELRASFYCSDNLADGIGGTGGIGLRALIRVVGTPDPRMLSPVVVQIILILGRRVLC